MKFLSILFLIFIASCSSNESKSNLSGDYSIINIDPESAKELDISSIYSAFHFTKLKAPAHVKFGNIDKIVIKNERIYILDRERALKLLVFDIEGNFIYEISKYGRGPGEFLVPNDFVVDQENEKLVIFDSGNFKVMFFDEKDGKYIEEKKLGFLSKYFAKTNDGFVFFNNNLQDGRNNKNIIFTNNNLDVIARKLPIPEDQRNFHYLLLENFISYNDSLFLNIPFDDKIYSLAENDISIKYKIDFKNVNIPDSFFKTPKSNRDRVKESTNYATGASQFFETDEYVYLRYRLFNAFYYYYKSKKTNIIFHTRHDLIENDIELGSLDFFPLQIYKDYMVWSQHPYQLKEYLEEKRKNLGEERYKKFQEENPKLMELDESLSEDDNSYLIFTKIDF